MAGSFSAPKTPFVSGARPLPRRRRRIPIAMIERPLSSLKKATVLLHAPTNQKLTNKWGRAFSQRGTPSAFFFDYSLWSHISAISAFSLESRAADKKPRPIVGRGCIGLDTKLLCMHFCCRAESTPRHHDTLFLFRCGINRPFFRSRCSPTSAGN